MRDSSIRGSSMRDSSMRNSSRRDGGVTIYVIQLIYIFIR